jgi:hypothetical protein
MRRLLLVITILLLAADPVAAQFDHETKTRQRWQVVLKVQPHPLLSGAFRDQLRRDVVAALQPAFGALGSVETIDLAEVPEDKWDSLWQQFNSKGFAALDGGRDLNGVKTHFLTLEYRDGQYHLQARQYDGFAGLASPVVRKQSVRAPELVGRTAGLMLERDLGVTGSIDPVIAKSVEEVKVVVRGGQLGPIDRLVKVGDVFKLARIVKTDRPGPPPVYSATGKLETPAPGTVPPPALSSVETDLTRFTLLQVKEVGKDGTVRCSVISRYENPLGPGGRALGYRCMKLGTVESPLSVKLVSTSADSLKNPGAVIVRATERGFNAKVDARDTLQFQDKESVYRSGRDLKHIACVTVSLGPGATKTFPVPVLGPEPIAIPFEVNEKLEAQAAHMRSLLAASARVSNERDAQAVCFAATAALIKDQKNAKALQRAKGGFQAADAADKHLTDELARLKEYADLTPAAGRLIATIESNLATLRAFNTQLEQYVKTLEAVVAREDNPALALADVLQSQIGLHLGSGDVDQAISAYDQLIIIFDQAGQKTASDDAKAARDKLKAEWEPKGDAHRTAREYLVKTWPTLGTIPEIHGSLKRIESEVQVCIEKKDRYTLRKLLVIFSAARGKLNDLVAPLDATNDRALLESAKDAAEKLAALEIKITDFVNKKE